MKAKTKQELLDLYLKKHGNFYNYSLMDLDNKVNGKIKIICPNHGEFLQNYYDHIHAGCPACASLRKKVSQSKIVIHGISDLEAQFSDRFDFTNSVFKNTSSRLTVWCKKHSKYFHNTAHHIVRGAGCSECKKEKISLKKRLGTTEFVNRSKNKHGNRYDYTLVEYKTLTEPVKIICYEHGEFEQKPREHINGHGCPLCASTTISAVSQKWLLTLGVNLIKEHKIAHNTGYYVVDGYDPKTNTVYEFYGDYWHGNPACFDPEMVNPSVDKKFKELYNNTMLREQALKFLGYNLITIWESEFNAKTT